MFHMDGSEIEALQNDRRRDAEANHQLIGSAQT
jgi:hypothetical protein